MSSLAREGQVSKTYSFDKVFGPEADQTCVYKEVGESMLDEVLRGYNCTIFAYGQTGTGKTWGLAPYLLRLYAGSLIPFTRRYTMQGDLNLTPLQTPSPDAGIIPRVLHRLFHLLDSTANAEWSVKCSYIELYNEELRDLLSADYREPGGNGGIQPLGLGGGHTGAAGNAAQGGLKIYEDQNKRGGVTIQGLEEASVRNLSEALALLIKGTQRRQVAETKMNSESSSVLPNPRTIPPTR
jgi:kinesin family protein 11